MTATAKIGAPLLEAPGKRTTRALGPAALACMGVVFGDIGTSPLYTLNVAAKSASPTGQITPEAVLGIVSLIFWSLIIVISFKYAILIMRADNHGEGGILALLALVSPRRAKRNRWRAAMVVIGLIGATLLYGDGTITPAISVLSAIEGLKIYAPQLDRAVVPADRRHPRHPVSHPAQRHIVHRRHIRAGDAGLVHHRRRARRDRDRAIARGARRSQSAGGHHLSLACRAAGSGGDRRRFSGRDRGRGVLRRHGPFRPPADPRRLVRRGAPGADPQLFRPGRPAACRAQLA